jgi:pimeloyl-ACP methyl ester carboxylesterase
MDGHHMNDSQYEVHGKKVWCDRSAKAPDPSRPTLVLLHGALNDHSVWSHLAGQLAQHGLNVLAPDLPGHGRSAGPALDSVEAMADWLPALLDAAGIETALLTGHSMGSLVALETARRMPARVAGLALLGTASPMRVSSALLAMARDDEAAAIDTVSQWSHANPELRDASRQLMRQVAAHGQPGLLHLDLAACNAYAGGEQAIEALDIPVHFILGRLDKMTPPRAAQALAAAARHPTLVEVEAGHAMMAEQPQAVLDALLRLAPAPSHAS